VLRVAHHVLGVLHRLTKTPPVVRRPTPRLGAHTVEVLGEWLGMSPAEAAPYVWPKPS
jgi:crotonobetainyl-CoA:carnitine CoA-transferase CaiB-like acyl-CoA transferase